MAAPIDSDESELRAIFHDALSKSDFEGFDIAHLNNAQTTTSINQAANDQEQPIDVENGWVREDTPPLNSPFLGSYGLNVELADDPGVLDFFSLLFGDEIWYLLV